MLIFIHLFAKNVLIINSYSIQLDWTKGELEGILKKLKKRSDVKSYVEFMDTKVFRPTPIRKYNFFEYLKFGSYPAVITANTEKEKKIKLASIVEDYFYKDVRNLLNKVDFLNFNKVLKVLAEKV